MAGEGGFISHEFESLYTFVEIIFSLLLNLMRVFSKYLIRISGIQYIYSYRDMTQIDEKYMDIKPQTNMHISEGWRAYRHDRLFIEVYNTFWHNFGCDTHTYLT